MESQRFNVPVFGQGPSTGAELDDLYLDDLFGSELYWSNAGDPPLSSGGSSVENDDFQTSTHPSTSIPSMNLALNLPISSSISSSSFNINHNKANSSISAHNLSKNGEQKSHESLGGQMTTPAVTLSSSPSADFTGTKINGSNANIYVNATSNPSGSFEMNAWLVPPTLSSSSNGTSTTTSSLRTRGKRGSVVGGDTATTTTTTNESASSGTTITTATGGKGVNPLGATNGTGRKGANTKTTTSPIALTDPTHHHRPNATTTTTTTATATKSRSAASMAWDDNMDDDDDSDDDDDDDEDDDSGNEGNGHTGSGKRKRSSKDPNDRIARSRERNRIHARKSRMRKKFFMDSLKTNLDNLEEENRRLRSLLQSETGKSFEEHLQSEKNGGSSSSKRNGSNNSGSAEDEKSIVGNPQRILAGPGIKPSIILDGFDYALVQALTTGQQNFVVTDPNLHDNPIVFASQGFYNLTGYNPNEVIGRNCRFLQGPATDPDAIRTIRQSISKGLDTAVCLINYKKDGTPFWNQFFIAPLCGTDGRIVNFVGVQCEVKESVARLLLAAQLKALQSSNDTAAATVTPASNVPETGTGKKK